MAEQLISGSLGDIFWGLENHPTDIQK